MMECHSLINAQVRSSWGLACLGDIACQTSSQDLPIILSAGSTPGFTRKTVSQTNDLTERVHRSQRHHISSLASQSNLITSINEFNNVWHVKAKDFKHATFIFFLYSYILTKFPFYHRIWNLITSNEFNDVLHIKDKDFRHATFTFSFAAI